VSLPVTRWAGTATQSGSVPTDQPALVLNLGDGPLTILRTRAWCQITYASPDILPAYNPGNSFAPTVMRAVAVLASSGTDPFWPSVLDESALSNDDLLMEALEWQTPFYIPPNAGTGRPEEMVQYAKCANGIGDSAAQRRFPDVAPVEVHVAVAQLDAGGGTVDLFYNAFIWIKCLVRYQ